MARSSDDPRLTFKCLSHDDLSGITKEFQMRFFFLDHTVELADLGTKRLFLKRTAVQGLDRADFVLGKKVVVFGRQLHLEEYMDVVTRQLCEGGQQPGGEAPSRAQADRCYMILPLDPAFRHLGKALAVVEVELGLTVTGVVAGTLPSSAIDAARKQEQVLQGQAGPEPVIGGLGGCTLLDLAQSNRFRNNMVCIISAAKPSCHRLLGELMQRLEFGEGRGAVWVAAGAQGLGSGESPLERLVQGVQGRTAQRYRQGAGALGAGSVVVLKPHLLSGRRAGDVLQMLLEELGRATGGDASIGALALVSLSHHDAGVLMGDYRGVLPSYAQVVTEMAGGASLAVHFTTRAVVRAEVEACSYSSADCLQDEAPEGQLEAVGYAPEATGQGQPTGSKGSIFELTRDLCGPYDPKVAKLLRRDTLRARFGVDETRNAVHCCDLPDDAEGMGRFFFSGQATKPPLQRTE